MQKFFFQPFPSYQFSIGQLVVCLLSGILVFLIFYVWQPFNINTLPDGLSLVYSLVYGGVTTIVLLIMTVLIPLLFPFWFNENQWIVAKELFFVVLITITVAAGNLIANHLLENSEINLKNLLKFIWATFMIGLVPIGLSVLFKQKILLNKYRQTAEILNEKLEKRKPTNNLNFYKPDYIDTFSEKIIISGDSPEELLKVSVDQIWLLNAADNYVNIVYLQDEVLKTILFRTSLKKLENSLSGFDRLVRCHRSYIINISKIEKTVASSQGLKFKLANHTQWIPVGKTYLKVIQEKIKDNPTRTTLHSPQK